MTANINEAKPAPSSRRWRFWLAGAIVLSLGWAVICALHPDPLPGPDSVQSFRLRRILAALQEQPQPRDPDDYCDNPGWYDPANRQALRSFIAQHPETEDAYVAEVWLMFAQAAPERIRNPFERRRVALERARRLETIAAITRRPGTAKMAELEKAFQLELGEDHPGYRKQVDRILARLNEFQSEQDRQFSIFCRLREMPPPEIEPYLRRLLIVFACQEGNRKAALAEAEYLQDKFPQWSRRNGIGGDISLLRQGLSPYLVGFVEPLPKEDVLLARESGPLGLRLLRQLAAEHPGTNILLSPSSLSAVLQLVCQGARGETREEMRRFLGIDGFEMESLKQPQKELNESLQFMPTNMNLQVKAALWHSRGIALLPEFVACNRDFYGAELRGIDFNESHSLEGLNAWPGEIGPAAPAAVPALSSADARVLITSSVSLTGGWLTGFDRDQTASRPFHLDNGRQKQVLMMQQTNRLPYRRGDGFEAVRLPCPRTRLLLYVFVPNPDSSLDRMLVAFDGAKWPHRLLGRFRPVDGSLALPRFTLDCRLMLGETLAVAGMKRALAPADADFSGLSKSPLALSEVREHAFLEIAEGGHASLVSSLDMMDPQLGTDRVPQPSRFDLTVDRPFFFIILDSASMGSLFMGVVCNPTETVERP
jgi:serpin B